MGEDKIINIIYLLGIILLFLPFIINSGKKGILQLLIWIFIILFVILLYSYKNNFTDIKNRIYMELFPDSAISDGNNKIIINSSMDNHFYVKAIINNKNIRFMIDTGASDIILSYSDAKKIGINTRNLQFNKRYHTANGIIYNAIIYVDKITIAGIDFSNIRISVSKSNMTQSLLGISFLKKFRKYEFYGNKLILEK